MLWVCFLLLYKTQGFMQSEYIFMVYSKNNFLLPCFFPFFYRIPIFSYWTDPPNFLPFLSCFQSCWHLLYFLEHSLIFTFHFLLINFYHQIFNLSFFSCMSILCSILFFIFFLFLFSSFLPHMLPLSPFLIVLLLFLYFMSDANMVILVCLLI